MKQPPMKIWDVLAIGMAMFSMFFGSGNTVFPVLVGQATRDQAGLAILGLLVTAVVVPFFAMVSVALYKGDYFSFFGRLGKVPGWTIIAVIMGLIGPFAVIPRCIIISHATFSVFWPTLNLALFSAVSCLAIYLMTFRKTRVLDILGKYLTPLLLLALATIIFKGLGVPSDGVTSDYAPMSAFLFGALEGYNMMDVFAACMFSGVVLAAIRERDPGLEARQNELLKLCLKCGMVGMCLLGAIYAGMCLVAARYSESLAGIPGEQLLARLTVEVLGSSAGVVVCVAVALACLTTAISLALVFADFVANRLLHGLVSYNVALIGTLLVSCLLSTLQFSGVQSILVPVLKVSLPGLIVLAAANFLFKTIGVRSVRIPVLLTFLCTLGYYLWSGF